MDPETIYGELLSATDDAFTRRLVVERDGHGTPQIQVEVNPEKLGRVRDRISALFNAGTIDEADITGLQLRASVELMSTSMALKADREAFDRTGKDEYRAASHEKVLQLQSLTVLNRLLICMQLWIKQTLQKHENSEE